MAKLLLDVVEPLLPTFFPLPLLIRGWLITFFVPAMHRLIETISGGGGGGGGGVGIMPHSSAIFSSSVNVLEGAKVLLFLLWNGHGPVVPLVGVAPVW